MVPNEDFLALRTAAEFFTAPAVTKNCCAWNHFLTAIKILLSNSASWIQQDVEKITCNSPATRKNTRYLTSTAIENPRVTGSIPVQATKFNPSIFKVARVYFFYLGRPWYLREVYQATSCKWRATSGDSSDVNLLPTGLTLQIEANMVAAVR